MANHLPITSSCPLRHARVYHDFRERQRPRAEKSIASLHAPSLFAWLEHTPDCCASAGPVLVLHMGKHMDAKTTALCYFYRHPPRQYTTKHSTPAHVTAASLTYCTRHTPAAACKGKNTYALLLSYGVSFGYTKKKEMKTFAFLFSGTGALSSVRK